MTFQVQRWGLLDNLVGRMGMRLFEGRKADDPAYWNQYSCLAKSLLI